MPDEFYTAGAENALTQIRLVKVGFAGVAGRGLLAAGRALWGGARGATTKAMSGYGKHVTQPLQRAGEGAEKWMGQQASKHMSPRAAVTTRKLIKGVPSHTLRQGAGFAAIGGAGGGAMGAASAEPGSRLEGALSGAGKGALSWGLMGATGAGVGAATRNAGRMGVSRIARSQGLPWNSKLINQQMNQGWLKNVKGIAKPGESPLGRAGAAAAAATGTGALGADMYATLKLDEAMQGKPSAAPQQPAPAQHYSAYQPDYVHVYGRPAPMRTVTAAVSEDQSPLQQLKGVTETIPKGYLGSAVGGTVAGLGTAAAIHALKAKKIIPPSGLPALGAQIAPSIAGSTGGLVGYTVGSRLDPSAQDLQLKKLEDIDLDKLMRYYKKQPAS